MQEQLANKTDRKVCALAAAAPVGPAKSKRLTPPYTFLLQSSPHPPLLFPLSLSLPPTLVQNLCIWFAQEMSNWPHMSMIFQLPRRPWRQLHWPNEGKERKERGKKEKGTKRVVSAV